MVLLKAVLEVMLMIQLLRNMKVTLKLPMMMRVDNVVAISMTGKINATT